MGYVERQAKQSIRRVSHDDHTKPSSLLAAWLAKLYKGKVIYISGESTSSPVLHDNTYLLGPSRMDERDYHVYQLYYFQMVYWQKYHLQSRGDLLWNHGLKPRNTGKHFLIYAQGNCVSFREEAFDELSKIGPVHQGGKCKGLNESTNKTVIKTHVSLRNWWDNVNVYREYRYCLVMEHGNFDGYITEKILMAFAGGCIPIYYGTIEVWNVFNKNAFIFYDIEDPSPALNRVAYLERNPSAYAAMMDQPILANGNKTIEDFFSFSDTFGNGIVKRRIRETLELDKYAFIQNDKDETTDSVLVEIDSNTSRGHEKYIELSI